MKSQEDLVTSVLNSIQGDKKSQWSWQISVIEVDGQVAPDRINSSATIIKIGKFGTEERDFFRGTIINFWPIVQGFDYLKGKIFLNFLNY